MLGHLNLARGSGTSPKAEVVGEVLQVDVEVHLHVVIEHLVGHAAQVMKRTFVAIQKSLQGAGAALDELAIHRPAVAQQHQEEVDGTGAATGGDLKSAQST